jgi:hypothetical protein
MERSEVTRKAGQLVADRLDDLLRGSCVLRRGKVVLSPNIAQGDVRYAGLTMSVRERASPVSRCRQIHAAVSSFWQ